MSTASVFLLWFINEFILFYLWDLCIILLTMMDKQWISNWCLCLWLDRQTHHWLDRDHTLIETDKLTKDNWNAEKLFVVSLDRRKTEDSLKLAASKTDLCKKKKNYFYFYSENQRGYLTDLSICHLNRVDETKDTKDVFSSTVCA